MASRKDIDWLAAYHAARKIAQEPNKTPEQKKKWLDLAEHYKRRAGYDKQSNS